MRFTSSARHRPRPSRSPGFGAVALVVLALLAPAGARAADVAAVRTSELPAYTEALAGFRDRYRGAVDVYDLEGMAPAALAAKVRAAHPRVVLAIGSKAAAEVARLLPELPLVYCMVLAPEKRGLTGPRMAGVGLEIPAREQLKSFRRVVQDLKRVGVVYNPAKTGDLVKEARAAAAALGVTLVERPVAGTAEVPDAVGALVGRIDGLWLIPDASVVTLDTFKSILLTSLERKLPLMVFSVAFVRAGALMGVVPDYPAIGAVAADLVRQILAGQPPGELGVRAPPSRIVINASTAARIGVTVDAAVRKDAKIVK